MHPDIFLHTLALPGESPPGHAGGSQQRDPQGTRAARSRSPEFYPHGRDSRIPSVYTPIMAPVQAAPSLEALAEQALGTPPATRPSGVIAKMRYSHDAMVDLIVQNPWISQNELAATFGYTPGWVSQVIASDAFQARLAERKEEVVDPLIRATIEEQFKGLVARSLEILRQKLDRPAAAVPDKLALRSV